MNNFYNRETLSARAVVKLIELWECEAGESFDDYCSFPREADEEFLEFLLECYPTLYSYHYEYRRERVDGFSWLEDSISNVFQHCVSCCTQWVPEDKIYLWNEQYTLAYYPLAEFILKNDIAWKTFVEFFTNPSNTTEDIPWIDCYDIRKDFEEWMKGSI